MRQVVFLILKGSRICHARIIHRGRVGTYFVTCANGKIAREDYLIPANKPISKWKNHF